MPNTASTDIEVAQRAMVLVGMNPLSTFTEATDEALVMNTTYEDIVQDCLAQHNWNFATGQKQLPRLSDVPLDRWSAAYALPTEPAVVQVQTVTVDSVVQQYDIYEKYLYINADINDDVILSYIFRPATSQWPPAFTLWVVYRLAGILALSVIRKGDIANSYATLAENQFRRAKSRDSQQTSTQSINLSRFTRVRLGSNLYARIEGETVE
tara:strand:- start:16 stop:645 length:630 start_codon:yes stop_codon:yes gene_type:complete